MDKIYTEHERTILRKPKILGTITQLWNKNEYDMRMKNKERKIKKKCIDGEGRINGKVEIILWKTARARTRANGGWGKNKLMKSKNNNKK